MKYMIIGLILSGCASTKAYTPAQDDDLFDRDFIIELTNRCKDISISKKSVKLSCPDSNEVGHDSSK